MAFDKNQELIGEVARELSTDDQTLNIIIVEHARDAGMLQNYLTHVKGFPKKGITQLGYMASDEQNASLLRKANPIVIAPSDIILNRPCTFFLPPNATSVLVVNTTQGNISTEKYDCGEEESFQLKKDNCTLNTTTHNVEAETKPAKKGFMGFLNRLFGNKNSEGRQKIDYNKCSICHADLNFQQRKPGGGIGIMSGADLMSSFDDFERSAYKCRECGMPICKSCAPTSQCPKCGCNIFDLDSERMH